MTTDERDQRGLVGLHELAHQLHVSMRHFQWKGGMPFYWITRPKADEAIRHHRAKPVNDIISLYLKSFWESQRRET